MWAMAGPATTQLYSWSVFHLSHILHTYIHQAAVLVLVTTATCLTLPETRPREVCGRCCWPVCQGAGATDCSCSSCPCSCCSCCCSSTTTSPPSQTAARWPGRTCQRGSTRRYWPWTWSGGLTGRTGFKITGDKIINMGNVYVVTGCDIFKVCLITLPVCLQNYSFYVHGESAAATRKHL